MLISILFLSLLQFIQGSCPDGFELVRDGQCRGAYGRMIGQDHDTAISFAISKCEEVQALPIIIRSQEDQSYWQSKINDWAPLGIVCNTNSKRWEWADGSTVDFNPPPYNCPDDCTSNKDCVTGISWFINQAGYWDGAHCNCNITLDIYCTKQLEQPVPSGDGCESFEDDSEDGVCYKIAAAVENWHEAGVICRSFGADLASIHNQQENSFIRRLAVSRGEVKGVYIGATISGKGHDYGWIDGTEWDYSNFYPDFPMDGLGECAMMDTESTAGLWANVDCSTKLSAACVRQQNYSTPACSNGPWKEGQVIYSPGFPFDASTPCDFILSVDAGKKVEVEILLLEANTCCDTLIVFENYFGGDVVANLTGEISDKTYTTVSSNFMRVSWQPSSGVNVRGMMMTFRGV